MEKVKVYFELCHPQAQIPRYAHPGDAGMDVFAVEDVQIAPGETVIVRTGWKVANLRVMNCRLDQGADFLGKHY